MALLFFFIKESLDQGKSTSGVISAKQAEDLRLKEKKRREHEVCNMLMKWCLDNVLIMCMWFVYTDILFSSLFYRKIYQGRNAED